MCVVRYGLVGALLFILPSSATVDQDRLTLGSTLAESLSRSRHRLAAESAPCASSVCSVADTRRRSGSSPYRGRGLCGAVPGILRDPSARPCRSFLVVQLA